jgi:hypothetical protein
VKFEPTTLLPVVLCLLAHKSDQLKSICESGSMIFVFSISFAQGQLIKDMKIIYVFIVLFFPKTPFNFKRLVGKDDIKSLKKALSYLIM